MLMKCVTTILVTLVLNHLPVQGFSPWSIERFAMDDNESYVEESKSQAPSGLILPLSFLFAIPASGQFANPECTFQQNLENGKNYYVFSPGYPNPYYSAQTCQWTARSDYRVKLTCDTFDLPRSTGCTDDHLSVKLSPNATNRYCGSGGFSVESEGNEMFIKFQSPYWSRGGKFLCTLQSIERDEGDQDCHCGWKNPNRIVGGMEAGVNEYPMMAGIVDSREKIIFCGSTIISPKYLLTAAHCFTNRNLRDLGVVVGEHDVKTGDETNATRLFRVEKYKIHPQYNEKTAVNDIAVITVMGKIEFTNLVGPACLPFQHKPDTFAGDYVTLLGWGTLKYSQNKATVLHKVTVSVITNRECNKYYNGTTNTQICTYTAGKDSCQSDSGGPVLWENPTTHKVDLIGIISYGGICGKGPGVNTRVGAHMDWIVSQTSRTRYCMEE